MVTASTPASLFVQVRKMQSYQEMKAKQLPRAKIKLNTLSSNAELTGLPIFSLLLIEPLGRDEFCPRYLCALYPFAFDVLPY
jgi:hypothetical protein